MANKEFDEKLGKLLRSRREAMHMTQQDVADKLGVTRVAVHSWESGKRGMYAFTFISYCKAVGIPPHEIMNEVI